MLSTCKIETMSSFPVSQQPKRFSIVREQHLSENMWIKKPKKESDFLAQDLKALESVDQLHITRRLGNRGTICNGNQQYRISDQNGTHLFNAREESTCCCVHCCGPSRSYTMTIEDRGGRSLLNFQRPVRCDDTCWCCCGCGLMEMKVMAENKEECIGKIKQKWSLWREKFSIESGSKLENLTIVGPNVTCRCCTNLIFKIKSEDGEDVGEIWKRWQERGNENLNEDHENFGVTFAGKLKTEVKSLLLAATFLLNHTFFEMS